MKILRFLAFLIIPFCVFSDIRKGAGSNYTHIYGGVTAYEKVYLEDTLIWSNTAPPTIASFTANPESIDLDTRATGTIRFTWDISGSPTMWAVYRGMTRISNNFVGNTARVQGFTDLAQPNQTSVYTLLVNNDGGAVSYAATVTVTQNPVVSNLAVSFAGDRLGNTGGTVRIQGRVKGYPRPEISVSPGWSYYPASAGHINPRHFTPVSGVTNTWAFTTEQYHGLNPGEVTYTVTGTNSSGSGSAQVTLH